MIETIAPEILNESRALVPRIDDAIQEFASPLGGVARMQSIARQFADIMKAKPDWAVTIKGSNKPHLRIEAWTTLGALCGIAAAIDSVTRDEWGYQAKADIIRLATGESSPGAYNRCDFDETYPGSTRKRWEESHAVLSMAQTRAASKALALRLRFIPELVGYSGTPLEEMPTHVERGELSAQHSAGPTVPSATSSPRSGQHTSVGPISDGQRRRLWAIWNARVDQVFPDMARSDREETLRALVKDLAGVESSRDIPWRAYTAVCSAVEAWLPTEVETGTLEEKAF